MGVDANGNYVADQPIDLGSESSLSTWVGPYVTDMLGRGHAAADQPYQAYTGPLTAGQSGLQDQAYTGIGSLIDESGGVPEVKGLYDPTSFTGTLDTSYDVFDPSTGANMVGPDGQPVMNNSVAGQYMNPYLQQSLAPQIAELRRQSGISGLLNNKQLTQAGAYGGSRQAIMDSERDRNLLSQIDRTQSAGYKDAYDRAASQFNTEEDRNMAATRQGYQQKLDVLKDIANMGAQQRGIASEGIAADYQQFKDERDYPMKQAQYMQSLLQGLPMETQTREYSEVNPLSAGIGTAGGVWDILDKLFT